MDFLKTDELLNKILKCLDYFLFFIKDKFKKLLTNLAINKELMRNIEIFSDK